MARRRLGDRGVGAFATAAAGFRPESFAAPTACHRLGCADPATGRAGHHAGVTDGPHQEERAADIGHPARRARRCPPPPRPLPGGSPRRPGRHRQLVAGDGELRARVQKHGDVTSSPPRCRPVGAGCAGSTTWHPGSERPGTDGADGPARRHPDHEVAVVTYFFFALVAPPRPRNVTPVSLSTRCTKP